MKIQILQQKKLEDEEKLNKKAEVEGIGLWLYHKRVKPGQVVRYCQVSARAKHFWVMVLEYSYKQKIQSAKHVLVKYYIYTEKKNRIWKRDKKRGTFSKIWGEKMLACPKIAKK